MRPVRHATKCLSGSVLCGAPRCRRYAGQGAMPATLREGAPLFSVPRLSTFILPEDLVRRLWADGGERLGFAINETPCSLGVSCTGVANNMLGS